MIEIRVNGFTCEPGEIEVGAAGSYGMQELHFTFSAEWDGLAKRTTWMTDAGKIEVLLDGLDRCEVPAEATATAGRRYFSVDGMAGGKHQISARAVYKVRETVPPGGENSSTPTDEEMVQALAILEEMKALKTPEVEVGTTKTVAAGNPAKVQNSGTATKAVLDFEIPRGESGVYVGEEEPGEDVMLWIVPEGENEIDEAILDINESVVRAEKAAQEAEGAVTGAAEDAAKIAAEAVVGETKDELQNYVDAAQKAAEVTAHPPEIREDVWWVWDTGKNAYVSSGISAAGVPGAEGKPGEDGQDGVSPTVSVTTITGGKRITITDSNGAKTFDIMDGEDGQDGSDGAAGANGVSPTVSVAVISGGHRVSITDVNGTKSFDVMDGEDGGGSGGSGADGEDGVTFYPSVAADGTLSWTNDGGLTNPDPVNIKGADGTDGADGAAGKDGDDGVSPVVSVAAITGSHRITITDANGTKTVDIMDGAAGNDGAAGKDGASVTVTNVTESTEDGGSNVVTFSDGKTLTVKNGSKGNTPVKGTDYFTDADKTEMVNLVLSNFTDVSEVGM